MLSPVGLPTVRRRKLDGVLVLRTHGAFNAALAGWDATSVVRITDVQPNRFTIYIHEAPNVEDNNHATESVSWIVLEAGSWTLPDGTRLAVGTTDTAATVGESIEADQWAHVTLGSPFGATPVVVSQVQPPPATCGRPPPPYPLTRGRAGVGERARRRTW
jgi:hypothetical protein